MQLTAILPASGEPMDGSSENLADDPAGAETSFPFAVMLSGALALLAPDQDVQAPTGNLEPPPASGTAVGDAGPSSVLVEGVELLVAEPGTQPLELEAAPVPKPVPGEAQAGNQPETTLDPVPLTPRQGLQHVSVESGTVEAGVGSALDAGSQAVVDESALLSASGGKTEGLTPGLSDLAVQASADAEAAGAKPASSGAAEALRASQRPSLSDAAVRTSSDAVVQASVDAEAAGLKPATAGTEGAAADAPKQTISPSVARQITHVSDAAPTYREAEAVGVEEAAAEPAPGERPTAYSRPVERKAVVDRQAQAVPAPVVPDAKDGGATEVKAEVKANAVPDHTAAPDGDVALPDPEGATQEDEAEASAGAETKARTTPSRDGDVSPDAGGDQDQGAGKERADRSSRSRAAHRDKAAPDALNKTEQSAPETAQPQAESAKETRMPEASAMPEEATGADPAMPDPDPNSSRSDEQVAFRVADKSTAEVVTGRVRAGSGLFQQNRAVPVAWLRAVLNNARQAVFSEGGWKVLEMNLDDGEGTVTIKARREEGRVAVAVGFSDPDLGALASANADRLQEALQAEYDAAVDFSLFNGDGQAGDSDRQQQAGRAGASIGGPAHAEGADGSKDRPARRSLQAGTHHEWVG